MKVLILGLSKSGTSALAYKIYHSLPAGDTALLFEPQKFTSSPATEAVARAPIGNVWQRLFPRRSPATHMVAKVLIEGHLWSSLSSADQVIPPVAVDLDSFAPFDKRIVIVRDPKDRAISAELYRLYHEPYCRDEPFIASVLGILRQKEAAPDAVRFVDFFKFVEDYSCHAGKTTPSLPRFEMPPEEFTSRDTLEGPLVTFLSEHPEYFVVHYEDLIDGKLGPLEVYLGLRVTGSAQIDVGLRRVERTKTYGNYKDWFHAEDVPYFKFLYRAFLERFPHYDQWSLNRNKVIRREHASGYVERIVNEARADRGLRPIFASPGTPGED